MKNEVGLWIDHKKTTIVFIHDNTVTSKTIESQIEPRVRLSGGARSVTPYGPQEIVSDTRRDAQYKLHLKKYYEKITDNIRKADDIFIFGPGEAKLEFKKHLEKSKAFANRIKGIETTDKLTDTQIKTRVKDFFDHIEEQFLPE